MELERYIMEYEKTIRMSFFGGMLALIGLWEFLSPRRKQIISRIKRWPNNLGIVFLNSAVLQIIFPFMGAGMAALAIENDWGIFNIIEVPYATALVLSIIIMDMVIYLQHVMVHAVPLLWRLHQVHHADTEYDVTTGARFHTLEIILSMGIKFATIALLGAPVAAVVIFEIILNAAAMFNHGNIKLPESIDKILRWFIVTPDMHRIHHSTTANEANSNFGFNLPWWDRIFGTYKAQPEKGHEKMEIGIHSPRDEKRTVWITGMLILPFLGKISDYAINHTHNKSKSN